MKKRNTLLVAFVLMFAFTTSSFAVNTPNVKNQSFSHLEFLQDVDGLTFENFLTLTPQQYQEKTGEKLNIFQTAKLKIAQKKAANLVAELNPAGPVGNDDQKVLIYLLAWFVPPAAVYLIDDGITKRFWVNCLLTLLCGLPGIIHAFILASKHFK